MFFVEFKTWCLHALEHFQKVDYARLKVITLILSTNYVKA